MCISPFINSKKYTILKPTIFLIYKICKGRDTHQKHRIFVILYPQNLCP